MIDADGKAAVQEVRRLEKAQKDAGKASDQLATKSRGAQAGVNALGSTAGTAEDQLIGVANANKMAAGSMGNLVAQGNDVVTMLIAGQDPMQLAIQQGTQINQIWGQMGAKGTDAFRMIGGAIRSMISPINLITIGSIAAAGAMVGWLTSGQEEALTLEERIEAVDAKVSDLRETTSRSASDLRDEFGSVTQEVKELNRELATLQLDDLLKSAKAAGTELSGSLRGFFQSQTVAVENLFEGTNLTEITEGWTLEVARLLDEVGKADSIDAQLAAVEALQAALNQATGGLERMTGEQKAFYNQTIETEVALRRAAAAREKFDQSSGQAERDARLEYYQSRIQAEEYLKNARADELASMEAIYGAYVRTREQSDAQLATAQDMLAELQAQNNLQALIATHGEDSAEVAEARAAAERAVFEEMLASLDVSEAKKEALRAAFEEGLALSQLDMASTIAAGATEAERLAAWLGIAVSEALKLSTITPAMADEDAAMAQQVLPTASQRANQRRAIENFERLMNPRRGGGRRGGGRRASEADKEREAVEKLTQRLQDQLDILRETDPVQKEMLRNREALKGATAKEREAVEDLIATRLREEEALENHKALVDEVKDIGYDLFTSATQGADALEAAALRAADAIAEMVFQAMLLGEGPLAGLFGGEGLLTSFANALAAGITGASGGSAAALPAKAAGGMIYGPGGGASDDVLMWGSSGEFVVNAHATARHRTLLEQINAGALPAFATGGMIPGVSQPSGSLGGGRDAPTIIFENHSSASVQGEMQEVQTPGGGRAFKFVLADEVGAAMSLPGGSARKTLHQRYGIKPRGTNR